MDLSYNSIAQRTAGRGRFRRIDFWRQDLRTGTYICDINYGGAFEVR